MLPNVLWLNVNIFYFKIYSINCPSRIYTLFVYTNLTFWIIYTIYDFMYL